MNEKTIRLFPFLKLAMCGWGGVVDMSEELPEFVKGTFSASAKKNGSSFFALMQRCTVYS